MGFIGLDFRLILETCVGVIGWFSRFLIIFF